MRYDVYIYMALGAKGLIKGLNNKNSPKLSDLPTGIYRRRRVTEKERGKIALDQRSSAILGFLFLTDVAVQPSEERDRNVSSQILTYSA